MSGLVSLVVTLVVGGGIGAAAFVSAVNMQTSPPSQSPGSIAQPVIDYGSVD